MHHSTLKQKREMLKWNKKLNSLIYQGSYKQCFNRGKSFEKDGVDKNVFGPLTHYRWNKLEFWNCAFVIKLPKTKQKIMNLYLRVMLAVTRKRC